MMGTGFIDHSAGSSGAAASDQWRAGGRRGNSALSHHPATAGAGEKVDIKLIGDTSCHIVFKPYQY